MKKVVNPITSDAWIPVTEAMPEDCDGLHWAEELTIRFTTVMCCDVNTEIILPRNRLQGKKTGLPYLEQYAKDENWHWSTNWWEPTHWMPMPELPTIEGDKNA